MKTNERKRNKMKILLLIISILLPSALSAQVYRMQDIDPLDTLDEEDIHALRDTTLLTRRNLANGKKQVNALDYVLDDRYKPTDQSFDHKWYDHLYVGATYGLEQIMPQVDDFKFRAMSRANLFIGKELNKKNSLRLSAGMGWGYQRDVNLWLTAVQTRLDYLFNLSTHFNGYNPARRLEVSLLAGLGANVSWMHNTSTEFAPEGHFGLQFKCFTGPLGTISVEPYVGLSADEMDVSGVRNWHAYDIFYGVNVNYGFYLVDNLSKEARLKLLRSRLANDRMIDTQTLEKWRTPWFVEFSNGIVWSTSNALDFGKTVGHQTAVSVGRWLSPVMGFRVSAVSRTTKWREEQWPVGVDEGSVTRAYSSHYLSGRVEALFNPLGFLKTFQWDAPWGAYLAFGGEIGSLAKYSSGGKRTRKSESYDLGVHLWHRLSKDLQVFVEPRFTHNVYTLPEYNGTRTRSMHGDNNWGIDAGLTMLITSDRYSDMARMDETQNFIYRNICGFRASVGGGLSLLQHYGGYYTGGGLSWNGMAALEYAFNHIHAVRLHADWLNLNGRIFDGNALWNAQSGVMFTALNYEANLTNLCSGRFHNRRFDLEVYGGPALGFRTGDNFTLVNSSVKPAYSEPDGYEKKTMIGFDAGLKLTSQIGKGFSIFLSPTLYFMGNALSIPGTTTVGSGSMRMFETINLGVQYKIGKLRRNQEAVRRQRRQRDHDWNARQKQLEQKSEEQRKARVAARHANK